VSIIDFLIKAYLYKSIYIKIGVVKRVPSYEDAARFLRLRGLAWGNCEGDLTWKRRDAEEDEEYKTQRTRSTQRKILCVLRALRGYNSWILCGSAAPRGVI
jgi:hypothetical protein